MDIRVGRIQGGGGLLGPKPLADRKTAEEGAVLKGFAGAEGARKSFLTPIYNTLLTIYPRKS